MTQLILPRGRTLSLVRCQLMGILNLTPDSFSDGGRFIGATAAVDRVGLMLQQGASIIDIGGESTRPGAADVSAEAEVERVIPVLQIIRQHYPDVVISIDSSKTIVMQQALAAGADIINDVRALQDEGALELLAQNQVPVCLMHMQGQPRSMQHQPQYHNVVREVSAFLLERVQCALQAGIKSGQIILDPGFGFGKELNHNYQLLAQLAELKQLGYPVLAGMSRKSMIGQLLKLEVAERLAGSIACATIAVLQGAQIIRAHDIKETAQAIAVAEATLYGV